MAHQISAQADLWAEEPRPRELYWLRALEYRISSSKTDEEKLLYLVARAEATNEPPLSSPSVRTLSLRLANGPERTSQQAAAAFVTPHKDTADDSALASRTASESDLIDKIEAPQPPELPLQNYNERKVQWQFSEEASDKISAINDAEKKTINGESHRHQSDYANVASCAGVISKNNLRESR